jgi:hypothetical protein
MKSSDKIRNNLADFYALTMHPDAKLTDVEKQQLVQGPQNSLK